MSLPVVRVSASERQPPRILARSAVDGTRQNLPRVVDCQSGGPLVSYGTEPPWLPSSRTSSGAQSSSTPRMVDVDLPIVRRDGRSHVSVAPAESAISQPQLQHSSSRSATRTISIVSEGVPVIRSAPRPAVVESRSTHGLPLVATSQSRSKSTPPPSAREGPPADVLPVVRISKMSPRRGKADGRKKKLEVVASQLPVRSMDGGTTPAARVSDATLQSNEAPSSLTKRKKRKSIGSDFESHADLEAAKKQREVDELVELLPQAVTMHLLGGDVAVEQVPDAQERRRILTETVALRAGSDGATLANARRAWESFKAFTQERELPNDGLPASAALVASYLKSEGERAARGSGAQGGTTVANSRRVGLLWLKEKLRFPIEVDNIVALAAANPGQAREYRRADPASRKRKQSGSLPIQCYLQIETLASAKDESPMRFFARSLFAFSMLQSVYNLCAQSMHYAQSRTETNMTRSTSSLGTRISPRMVIP